MQQLSWKPVSQDRDNLSDSPFIFDILQYLVNKDVLKCKLVNRSFCYYIRRNYHRFPKPLAVIEIEDEYEYDVVTEYMLVVLTGKKRSSLRVTMEEIVFGRCENRHLIEHFGVVDSTKAHTITHTETSLGNALMDVLSILFSHYYVGLIFVNRKEFSNHTFNHDVFPSQHLINLISESLFRNESKCPSITLNRAWSGLSEICDKLGCRVIHIDQENRKLEDDLKKIANWENCHFKFKMSPYAFDSTEPIVELLKRWQTGETRIFFVTFFCDVFVAPNTFKISHETMECALKCFVPESVEHHSSTSEFPLGSVEFQIKRPFEDVQICVQYSRPHNTMIFEFTETEEVEFE